MNDKSVAVILEAVPHRASGGGITAYAIVQALLADGYRTTVFALSDRTLDVGTLDHEGVAQLERDGMDLVIPDAATVDRMPALLSWKRWSGAGLFDGVRYSACINRMLAKVKPDAIVAYHWSAVAAGYRCRVAPKLALVGDPPHLPRLFRQEMMRRYGRGARGVAAVKEAIVDSLVMPQVVRSIKRLLNDYEASGAFAAHHAEMLRHYDIPHCGYFATPVPDPLVVASPFPKSDKLKILHIGHLNGIATLSGVELLANEVIPALEQALPPESFEVHIVGGFAEKLPEGLRSALTRPCVKFRGQLSQPHEEFLSSHVVIVPTPIELGIRVRILTAFSYGCCVVAHEANKNGIPEMTHGQNCLMGSTGEDLARLCVQAFSQTWLRVAIEQGARETYEKHFSLPKAGSKMIEALARIIRT